MWYLQLSYILMTIGQKQSKRRKAAIGQLLTQTLHCEGDGLNSIQIPFSTGNRVNHCMIYADLIVDGECAQSWELPA